MDREQAIFILEDQANKHEGMYRVIIASGENIIAKQHKTIAEALQFAADELKGGVDSGVH